MLAVHRQISLLALCSSQVGTEKLRNRTDKGNKHVPVRSQSNIYRRSIEDQRKIYRISIEHLSFFLRDPMRSLYVADLLDFSFDYRGSSKMLRLEKDEKRPFQAFYLGHHTAIFTHIIRNGLHPPKILIFGGPDLFLKKAKKSTLFS